MQNSITVKSFNPYEARFPNRKVLSASEIDIIKQLRNAGIDVTVLPDDPRPIEYIFRKGNNILDFIYPFILTLWQEAPKEVVLNIINDWFRTRYFTSGQVDQSVKDAATQNLVIVENNHGTIINVNGDIVSPERIGEMISRAQSERDAFRRSLSSVSSYPDMPVPLHRDHRPDVVGWAKISMDNFGLHIDKSIITDPQTLSDIYTKKLKGFSVAGIASKSVCSVCGDDYVLCEHRTGVTYESIECFNTIMKATFVECSVVEEPTLSNCLLELLVNQQEHRQG